MAEKFFHYARSLFLSLLDHYPNCPAVRLMLRQSALVVRDDAVSSAFAILRTIAVNAFYFVKRSPLKHLNQLERVVTRTPDCMIAHRTFVRIALEKELWGTAALSLEVLATLNSKDTRSQVMLARCYSKLGRVEEAKGIIRTVLDRDPHNDPATEILKQVSVEQTLKNNSWNTQV